MSKRLVIGSEFISMNKPEDKPWLTNIYYGPFDGSGRHGHIVASGAILVGSSICADTWYARIVEGEELIKNGNILNVRAQQVLLETVPSPLKESLHPEKPNFWNIGSISSIFLRIKGK